MHAGNSTGRCGATSYCSEQVLKSQSTEESKVKLYLFILETSFFQSQTHCCNAVTSQIINNKNKISSITR
jgi:hypothetical protein